MNNPIALAMELLKMLPNNANNPNAQEMINVIQSGDSVRGEEIANNILQAYGMTKEQGIQRFKDFFRTER